VRRAGPPDVEAVTAVVETGIDGYRAWAPDWTPPQPSPESWERLRTNFASDDAWILIALDEDDAPVGVVSIAGTTLAQKEPPPPGTIYLWQMFVRAEWQGTGLAQALMDLAFEEARRRGMSRMVLWAAAGATQARKFYEREGWTLSGERKEDADFGLPLVQYEFFIDQ
jgi:GNAT superfamily N-acetyltransferase